MPAGPKLGTWGSSCIDAADSVADELADDTEAFGLTELLDGGGDVAEATADLALLDGLFEGGFGDFEEPSGLRRDLSDGIGDGGIGVVAIDDDATVDGEDVAFFEDALGVGDSVDDLVVDRGAEGSGIAVVALEGRDGAQFGDLCDGDLFEVHRRGAGNDMGRDGVMDLAEGLAGDPHLFDLLRRFDHDGHNRTRD